MNRAQQEEAAAPSRNGSAPSTRTLGVAGAALCAGTATAVLWHAAIDAHIGLFGATSSTMTPLQAANALAGPLIAGAWLLTIALATRGVRSATAAALVFASVHAFVMNGVVALVVAPPPSDAFPYQDAAHLLSLTLGALASVALWRVYQAQTGRVPLAVPAAATGLAALPQLLTAMLFFG